MARKKSYTINATGKGIEICEDTKEKKDKGSGNLSEEGRVLLRFFDYSDKSNKAKMFRFVMDVAEANFLGYKVFEILRASGKVGFNTKPHKFKTKDGQEMSSSVRIERWSDTDGGKYAIQLFRGKDQVNVSMDESHFLYMGTFLQHLAIEQSYSEYFGDQKAEKPRSLG